MKLQILAPAAAAAFAASAAVAQPVARPAFNRAAPAARAVAPTPNMFAARATAAAAAANTNTAATTMTRPTLGPVPVINSPFNNGIIGANTNGLSNVVGGQAILNPTAGVNNQAVFPGINSIPGLTTNTTGTTGIATGVTTGQIRFNSGTNQYVFTGGGTSGNIAYNSSTGQWIFSNGNVTTAGSLSFDPTTNQYTFVPSANAAANLGAGVTSPYFGGGYGYPYSGYSSPYSGYGYGYPYSSNGYSANGLAVLSNPALGLQVPQYRPVAPILGITTPAAPLVGRVGASTRYRVVDDTVTGGSRVNDQPQERVAGSRQETRITEHTEELAEVKEAPMTRQQVTLVNRAQEIMAERPITEGEVMAIGATGAQVKYRMNGEYRTDRFALKEVFFFRDNGEMQTAASAPAEVALGDRVLVPMPAEPKQISVTITKSPAGTGEVRQDGSITVTPAPSIASSSDNVQEKVAGSRESYSSSNAKVAGSRQTTRRRRAAH